MMREPAVHRAVVPSSSSPLHIIVVSVVCAFSPTLSSCCHSLLAHPPLSCCAIPFSLCCTSLVAPLLQISARLSLNDKTPTTTTTTPKQQRFNLSFLLNCQNKPPHSARNASDQGCLLCNKFSVAFWMVNK